jgi:isopentenyldiphosphate isomerase
LSFLDHIRSCNRWDPADFIPFRIGGERVGHVRRSFAEHLKRWPKEFDVAASEVTWVYPGESFEDRNRALQAVVGELEASGVVSHLHGEMYPVTSGDRSQVLMLVDRACAPHFGVRAFGQHMNGFVRDGAELKMWIGRRAADRRVYPLHLDNLVAGGLPWGVSLGDNLRKECWEEAGIPGKLADQARPVGAVTYCRDSKRGLKPDVMYCYDLELAPDFEPQCTDGEVESFHLWSVEKVMETVRETDEFKLNCNLVIIDFLVRHGYIPPDSTDYLQIIQGLRSPLP